MTALMFATLEGRERVVSLLLDWKADVNATDAEGITSLMLAGNEGRTEIARLLIKHGAKIN